jgi:hypothetical protein
VLSSVKNRRGGMAWIGAGGERRGRGGVGALWAPEVGWEMGFHVCMNFCVMGQPRFAMVASIMYGATNVV